VNVLVAQQRASSTASLDSLSSLADRLRRVDWSFIDRARPSDLEAIHPYPAKFIGDIPRTFLNVLPLRHKGAVLDIFCGSGTTLVEAQRVGRPAIGIDLNPIACLISRVKTAPLPRDFGDAAVDVVNRARSLKCFQIPMIPNVDHWFQPEVQTAVGALADTIAHPAYTTWVDQLRLVLSSILVRVSNQDSDTRYAAITKGVSRDDVFSSFLTGSSKIQRALLKRDWNLSPVQIIERNTLEVSPSEIKSKVAIAITSPPYPNAYEYWLYHKYRMWWLGYDPISVKNKEIGARAHFFKKNRHTAELFAEQMRTSLQLIDGLLVGGGFVCVVVGRSKIHGQVTDNGATIERVAQQRGFKLVVRLERAINSNRKSFNLSHANIKTETVLVFRKPG
jgi:DNA modification methylase